MTEQFSLTAIVSIAWLQRLVEFIWCGSGTNWILNFHAGTKFFSIDLKNQLNVDFLWIWFVFVEKKTRKSLQKITKIWIPDFFQDKDKRTSFFRSIVRKNTRQNTFYYWNTIVLRCRWLSQGNEAWLLTYYQSYTT